MDNTAYEQARGITVKSSCISLQYTRTRADETTPVGDKTYLINLIDSPGHMDFSGEVSSALRMTDGCYLVVDAIEGVCIQTRAVLRQAWMEKVKPVLVINKIDKLFTQLQLGPEEAYRQLLRTVEQVNLVLGELWIEQQILDADSAHMAKLKVSSLNEDSSSSEGVTFDVDAEDAASIVDKVEGAAEVEEEYKELEEFEFHPEKNNVVFASAFHGWGFSIEDFVEMYATKLKMNRKILRKTLWGEFYFNPKTRKIATRRPNANALTMFASLVLSNIHQIYTAIVGTADDMANAISHKGYSSLTHRDTTKLERIDKALGLSVPPRELKNEDMNFVVSAFMGRWLPISNALLEMAVTLPNPCEAQESRISILWHKSTHDLTTEGIQLQNKLHASIASADRSENAPVAAYVSKVFAVPNEQFPRNARIKLEPGKKTLIAMTRLFSGEIKVGDEVHILGARYNPATPEKHSKIAKIPQLWMLMGPDLQPVDHVQAGDVFGIGGEDLSLHTFTAEDGSIESVSAELASTSVITPDGPRRDRANLPSKTISTADRNAFVSNIVKTATLTTNPGCPVFGALNKHVNPIVRVAVEPESPADLETLESGMWLLHQADAAVHVEVQENGEFIIGALGELHLARCLEMLREEFARVPIKVSPPIVSFRETVLPGLAVNSETRTTVPTEIVVERTPDRHVTLVLRALRLPENITTWLETHAEETRLVQQIRQGIQQHKRTAGANAAEDLAGSMGEEIIEKWASGLRAEFTACTAPEWQQQADFVWAFGPHRVGPNIMLNNIPKYATSKYWRTALDTATTPVPVVPNPADISEADASASGHSLETLSYFGILQQLDSALRTGFQLATRAGPLCEEPLMGLAIQILDINVVQTPFEQEDSVSVSPGSFLLPDLCPASASAYEDAATNTLRKQLEAGGNGGFGAEVTKEQLGSLWNQATGLSGAVISATRTAIRRGFLARPQRLYEALFLAHIQVTALHMGKAYAVLNRRRSDILSDEINESSGLTLVAAMVPAAEASGFSEELVAKSGGAANAQLTFAKWSELDVDPNFIPTTEEELEEFGDNVGGIAPNLARKYVDGVRKRKGLAVMEKLVVGADKQRTLRK